MARFLGVKVWVGRGFLLSGLRSKIPLLTPNKEHKHGCVVSVESNPKSLSANAQREFLARPLSPLRFVLAWKGAHERLQVLLEQIRQLLDRAEHHAVALRVAATPSWLHRLAKRHGPRMVEAVMGEGVAVPRAHLGVSKPRHQPSKSEALVFKGCTNHPRDHDRFSPRHCLELRRVHTRHVVKVKQTRVAFQLRIGWGHEPLGR
mmetsp:Transcript_26979/g.55198  ORF Transcript_26979/g.55198 Transcript_26979/m.55198 type:complete len:204 (-) Transcript_26979:9-620(-)